MTKQASYLYSALAAAIAARLNCVRSGNQEWLNKHEDRALELVKQHMPRGSGFDSGTDIDFDLSHADKLVFRTSFHHMTEHGYYDGWTEHTVTVTPSFSGFNLRVSGRNKRDIKEYIAEMFHEALRTELE